MIQLVPALATVIEWRSAESGDGNTAARGQRHQEDHASSERVQPVLEQIPGIERDLRQIHVTPARGTDEP